jgi:uncharacterized protein YndB with AHSA1/START domain
MTEIAAEASTAIKAAPTKVWECITDLSTLSKYFMGATIKTDWHVGHNISWSGEWKGKAYEDKGKVVAFDRNERLAFSHWSPMSGTTDDPANYHLVDITLKKIADGTDVRLVQSNLQGGLTDADRKQRSDYEKNWSEMLKGLKQAAEGSS